MADLLLSHLQVQLNSHKPHSVLVLHFQLIAYSVFGDGPSCRVDKSSISDVKSFLSLSCLTKEPQKHLFRSYTLIQQEHYTTL